MKLKWFFSHRVTSMLLVLLLAFLMFPTETLAAESIDETHVHTEECTPKLTKGDEEVVSEKDGSDEPLDEPDAIPTSGSIGVSNVLWNFDQASGRLIISGSGSCKVFQSPEDQPWSELRTQITEVWFFDMEALAIPDLAYWFTGCTSLTTAEIPYTTLKIGAAAFADCPSLTNILFYYRDTDEFEIVPGAFAVIDSVHTTIWVIAEQQRAVLMAYLYDWAGDNRDVSAKDVYGVMVLAGCAIGGCNCTNCFYYYTYAPYDETRHDKYIKCTTCSKSIWLAYNSHSFSGNTCTVCGYTKSSGGGGGSGGTGCSHSSTSTSWSGCTWTEYCNSCGAYIDSGTSHSYSYGRWSYYSSTQHMRTGTCTFCHTTTTSYGSHSTTAKATQYNDTQHKTGSYCSACSSYIGSTSYANHSFTYGSWSNSSSTQHERTKTCSVCGYSTTEYTSHSLTYGKWNSYNNDQHRRTASCSTCGYSGYEYLDHSLSYGKWSSISTTQHQRTITCTCGYSAAETESHAMVTGDWVAVSETQHSRTKDCACGYSAPEVVDHQDTNDDGYCDDCRYLMTRFSVTVPVNLSLTISKYGEVYAANNASVINNSTHRVEITSVTVTAMNGWRLVPYDFNMADEKVDSRLIGFWLNGAKTRKQGTNESLNLPTNWTIDVMDTFPLEYDAVISATSSAIWNEQVLTLVFVIDWAPR